jgi:hypothetical protein
MNIFYLHNDAKLCAEFHNNKHVVKMILEYAQLMSTAHRVLDGLPDNILSEKGRRKTIYRLKDSREDVLYRATHINHPSAIWVRASHHNYVWLYKLWVHLMKEYTYRYGKMHASSRLLGSLYILPYNIPENVEFTEPTPAMPEEFKVSQNSVLSYINYYVGAKQHIASWKNRKTPEWYIYA